MSKKNGLQSASLRYAVGAALCGIAGIISNFARLTTRYIQASLLIILAISLSSTANADTNPDRPQYTAPKHTAPHGGNYQNGHGQSHKGGHYKNPKSHNHYGKHQRPH